MTLQCLPCGEDGEDRGHAVDNRNSISRQDSGEITVLLGEQYRAESGCRTPEQY